MEEKIAWMKQIEFNIIYIATKLKQQLPQGVWYSKVKTLQ